MAGLPQVPTTAPPSEDRPAPDALQTAGEIPIYDADGKEFLFRELYELKENAPSDELLMVIFIRHFYCSSCQAYVTAISEQVKDIITSPNQKIAIIGCGSPSLIKPYVAETSCAYPIYAEPTQKLYSTLGMTKTLAGGDKPKFLEGKGFLGLVGKSIGQALTWGGAFKGGDIQQVGGEFLFVGGECVWCHRMKTVRDHIEVEELMKVMGSAPAAGQPEPAE